jgi:hypothetical protein
MTMLLLALALTLLAAAVARSLWYAPAIWKAGMNFCLDRWEAAVNHGLNAEAEAEVEGVLA